MSEILFKIIFIQVMERGGDVLLVEEEVLVMNCESGVRFSLKFHDFFKVIPV